MIPTSSSQPSAAQAASTQSAASQSATSALDPLANEQTFLQLLVAQLQNQDPLNPTDSTQFVSQLAQFSELEQVIAIRGDTDSMASEMKTAASNSTTPASTTPTTDTPAAGTGASSGQNPTNGTTQA